MVTSTEDRPKLTVVGGPNGSGKSTFLTALVDAGYELGTIVNPDEIARAMQGSGGDTELPPNRDWAAGREALRLTRDLIARRQSFTRETTLTGSEILRTMEAAKTIGYDVTLIFIGVESVGTSKRRVRNRVREGGHNILEAAQDRRFERSFRNAPRAARIADRAYFFHSGERGYELLGEVENGQVTAVNLDYVVWIGKALAGLERAEVVETIVAPVDPIHSEVELEEYEDEFDR